MMPALALTSARLSKLWIPFLNHLLDKGLCKNILLPYFFWFLIVSNKRYHFFSNVWWTLYWIVRKNSKMQNSFQTQLLQNKRLGKLLSVCVWESASLVFRRRSFSTCPVMRFIVVINVDEITNTFVYPKSSQFMSHSNSPDRVSEPSQETTSQSSERLHDALLVIFSVMCLWYYTATASESASSSSGSRRSPEAPLNRLKAS